MVTNEHFGEPLAAKVASLLQTYSGSFEHRQSLLFEDLKVIGLGSGVSNLG